METLTTFEMLEFASIMRASWDAQFQYWLTITFAMVVARMSLPSSFTKQWRFLLAAMYFAASFLFFSRLMIDSTLGGMYRDAAIERGAMWIEQSTGVGVTFLIRILLIVIGTLFTTYLLMKSGDSDD